MEMFFGVFESYAAQLAAIGATIAFFFAVFKFQAERSAIQFWKEFEVYHKLVKELVQSVSATEGLYIDRLTAILFELRFYKRYHEHSLRMLEGLKIKYAEHPAQNARLIEEAELTIKYIKEKL